MLVLLIFYFLVIPLFVLLHELGHAIGVISTSKANAHVYLGHRSNENKLNFRFGRLHFHIRWSYIGFVYWDGHLNKRQNAVATAGGPLMSLLLVFLFGWIASWVPQGDLRSLFWATAIVNLSQFIGTIIPITYPRWWGGYSGFPSDGLQLLRLLRSQNDIKG